MDSKGSRRGISVQTFVKEQRQKGESDDSDY